MTITNKQTKDEQMFFSRERVGWVIGIFCYLIIGLMTTSLFLCSFSQLRKPLNLQSQATIFLNDRVRPITSSVIGDDKNDTYDDFIINYLPTCANHHGLAMYAHEVAYIILKGNSTSISFSSTNSTSNFHSLEKILGTGALKLSLNQSLSDNVMLDRDKVDSYWRPVLDLALQEGTEIHNLVNATCSLLLKGIFGRNFNQNLFPKNKLSLEVTLIDNFLSNIVSSHIALVYFPDLNNLQTEEIASQNALSTTGLKLYEIYRKTTQSDIETVELVVFNENNSLGMGISTSYQVKNEIQFVLEFLDATVNRYLADQIDTLVKYTLPSLIVTATIVTILSIVACSKRYTKEIKSKFILFIMQFSMAALLSHFSSILFILMLVFKQPKISLGVCLFFSCYFFFGVFCAVTSRHRLLYLVFDYKSNIKNAKVYIVSIMAHSIVLAPLSALISVIFVQENTKINQIFISSIVCIVVVLLFICEEIFWSYITRDHLQMYNDFNKNVRIASFSLVIFLSVMVSMSVILKDYQVLSWFCGFAFASSFILVAFICDSYLLPLMKVYNEVYHFSSTLESLDFSCQPETVSAAPKNTNVTQGIRKDQSVTNNDSLCISRLHSKSTVTIDSSTDSLC